MDQQNHNDEAYPEIETRQVMLNGEAFTVRPMSGRALVNVTVRAAKFNGYLQTLAPDTVINYKVLLGEFGDDLIEMTALALDKPVEFVDSLSADQMLELMIATFEVNHAFFFRRVSPVMRQGKEAIVKLSASGRHGKR
jgi:hypothetical protein